MPSKRDVLGHLSRDELVAAVDQFELVVADRRVKDQLFEAVASSKKASLGEILGGFSRDRLKEVCRALGLDDAGKDKATLVDRLTGARTGTTTEPTTGAMTPPEISPPPKGASAGRANGQSAGATRAAPAAAEKIDLAPGERLSVERLETYLWSAADILRGSIDSSDYKNFIFGLLFLKRLSDRFEEECEALRGDRGNAIAAENDQRDYSNCAGCAQFGDALHGK